MVGGGCHSGWGRLVSVTNAIETGTGVRGTVAGHWLGGLEGGGGVPPFQCNPGRDPDPRAGARGRLFCSAPAAGALAVGVREEGGGSRPQMS